MAVNKKKRTKKISQGIHGATKHPLTALEKVLAGKGLLRSIKHVECRNPWRGAADGGAPFDREQAELNKKLYPHLFTVEPRRTR